MSIRNRRSTSHWLFIGYSIIATMVVPFLLIKLELGSYRLLVAFLMGCGLLVAGVWSAGELFVRDVLTDQEAEDRRYRVIATLIVSVVLTVVMFVAAWLLMLLASQGWTGYNLLKSGGWVTYLLLGLLPVVAYILLLHAVGTRQIITSFGWRVMAIVCLVVSLLAPWFWVGFKVYSDYHVM